MTQLVDWNALDIPTALANGAHYEYAPYGAVINDLTVDADADGLADAGAYAAANAWRFSTKPFDAESGLGYWGYSWLRSYDPETHPGEPSIVQ